MMDAETRRNVGTRLKKVEGQVSAVRRMVEEERYCVDLLLQIAAARAARRITTRGGFARVAPSSNRH